ncbi:MAG TPA: hypothetical protein VLE21_04395 [Candidatus Nitrosocosmicus sp.]|nr:hypothetical protein [Candidatus Nitrosocosmicus sp.]
MKGKNFSLNNVDGKRNANDYYQTPYSITEQLLEREKLNGSILEPACGQGAIVKVLMKNGYRPSFYDLALGADFFSEKRKYDWVITNPPFKKAFEFIQKAKIVANNIAMLLPLSYLHGVERYKHIWNDKNFPLRKIYVFTRYPMLSENIRADGKYKTGMMVLAWFIWDASYKNEPIIDWIDNNEFIINKSDSPFHHILY